MTTRAKKNVMERNLVANEKKLRNYEMSVIAFFPVVGVHTAYASSPAEASISSLVMR